MRGGQGRERWEGWILGAGKAAGWQQEGLGFPFVHMDRATCTIMWREEEGRGCMGFWSGWRGISQRDCNPPGGMAAGSGSALRLLLPLPLPNRICFLYTASQTGPHCSWIPNLAVITGVSYRGKSRVTLSASLPHPKLFSKRRGLT